MFVYRLHTELFHQFGEQARSSFGIGACAVGGCEGYVKMPTEGAEVVVLKGG